jgi:hypothetical protein
MSDASSLLNGAFVAVSSARLPATRGMTRIMPARLVGLFLVYQVPPVGNHREVDARDCETGR